MLLKTLWKPLLALTVVLFPRFFGRDLMAQELKKINISLSPECIVELVDQAMAAVISYRRVCHMGFMSPITKMVFDRKGSFVSHRRIGKTEQFIDKIRYHYISCIENYILNKPDRDADTQVIEILQKHGYQPATTNNAHA